MRQLKVLSVDWDYFVNATAFQRAEMFPDPNDNLSQKLNDFLWTSHYAYTDELVNIGIAVNEFDELKKYLRSVCHHPNSGKVGLMITNSHKYIYDFVLDNINTAPNGTSISLFHIDFHTDCYGVESTDSVKNLDCGNWLNYLYSYLKGDALKNSRVTWLAREDSEYDEGIPEITERLVYDPTMDDLGDMIDSYFNEELPDLIFICKSNPWSPPHLDDKFDELFDIANDMVRHIGSVKYSNDIKNRYTKDFLCNVEELKKFNEKFVESFRKKG